MASDVSGRSVSGTAAGRPVRRRPGYKIGVQGALIPGGGRRGRNLPPPSHEARNSWLQRSFPDFGSSTYGEYACGPKSVQLRVSLRISAPHVRLGDGFRGGRSHPPQPTPDPRLAALLTLLDVASGHFPDEALEQHCFGLDHRDRSLASALVYGVLRWKSRLEWTIKHFLRQPSRALSASIQLILDMGLFQMDYLDRVPVSAAVNESVRLAKKFGSPFAGSLVNAVLRNISRSSSRPQPLKSGLDPLEALALEQAHPVWMVRKLVDQLGREATAALLLANNQPGPLTFRVNTNRTTRENLMQLCRIQGIGVEETTYAPEGLRVNTPVGPISGLPGFAQGYFSVQDEAAQIVGLMARPFPGEKVLDACAGRGGKTGYLAQVPGVLVVAMDPAPARLLQARSEIQRLSLEVVTLARGDLRHPPLPPSFFDVVLVDAPCSNLGVIRRRPDVKWSKTDQDPARLAVDQLKLLTAAADLVKTGGRLIYAVCTHTPEETLQVTECFQRSHREFRLQPARDCLPASAWPLVTGEGHVRTWPHLHGLDGFFAAVFRKVQDSTA